MNHRLEVRAQTPSATIREQCTCIREAEDKADMWAQDHPGMTIRVVDLIDEKVLYEVTCDS